MKYRSSAWPFRLLAWVLAAVCLAMGFLSGYVTLMCFSDRMYDQDQAYQTTYYCRDRSEDTSSEIIAKYRSDPDFDRWDRLLENSSLRFIILDEFTGEVKASYVKGLNLQVPNNLANNIYLNEYNVNFQPGDRESIFRALYVTDYYFGPDWMDYTSVAHTEYFGEEYGEMAGEEVPWEITTSVPTNSVEPGETVESYQILLLLPQQLTKHGTGDSIYEGYEIYRFLDQWKRTAPVLFLCSLALFVVCVIYLCLVAGRKPGQEELKGGWFDKLPLDLMIVVAGLLTVAICLLFCAVYDARYNRYLVLRELQLILALCTAGTTACGLLLVKCFVSFVYRMRAGGWWRNSVIWWVLRWCWRGCRWVGSKFSWIGNTVREGSRAIGMVPKAVLVLFAYLGLNAILLFFAARSYQPFFPMLLCILLNVFVLLAGVWTVAQLKQLQAAAKAMADGDLNHQLDTGRMYWDFKSHGDNLNAIAGGMSKAVEKQMKSERLKTELITNVSHDIKTPLTSIVNYVDLLQKPHTEAEGVEYLEVLDRQSKRLKRLTENLVEASKASTGNMAVQLESTSVMELVNQAVEEYRDRMEAGKLETVVSLRGDLRVMADGKLMWRVLDNLLNNVVKYALPGTRVYVTAQKWNDRVVIAVKNISRDPLNLDADELMERFVRGDSSRHTEGSGLGLSIVQSLTQLQNGTFTLTVDGDLFKAEVALPVVTENVQGSLV